MDHAFKLSLLEDRTSESGHAVAFDSESSNKSDLLTTVIFPESRRNTTHCESIIRDGHVSSRPCLKCTIVPKKIGSSCWDARF